LVADKGLDAKGDDIDRDQGAGHPRKPAVSVGIVADEKHWNTPGKSRMSESSRQLRVPKGPHTACARYFTKHSSRKCAMRHRIEPEAHREGECELSKPTRRVSEGHAGIHSLTLRVSAAETCAVI